MSGPLLIVSFQTLSKNNIPIDFNAYQAWRSHHPNPSVHTPASIPNGTSSIDQPSSATLLTSSPSSHEPTSSMTNPSEPPAPYPTSFSQIVELITNGQPIPGIKEVPDTILEGQASQPMTAKRKKPWENDAMRGGEESGLSIETS